MKKFNVTVNGKSYEVEIEEVKGEAAAAPAAPATKGMPKVQPKLTVNTKAAQAPAAPAAAAPAKPAVAPAEGEHAITAPMPGKIVKLNAEEGQSVKKGDVLLVLEAMKMQNEITADADGVVKAYNVIPGQNVKAKDTLVIIG